VTPQRISTAILAAACVGALLTGCTASAPASPPETTTTTTTSSAPSSGVLVTRAAATDDGYDVDAVSGILTVANGCVRLEDGTIPVFPDDQAMWDGTALTWKGEQYRPGERVYLGGREITGGGMLDTIPGGCGAGTVWQVTHAPMSAGTDGIRTVLPNAIPPLPPLEADQERDGIEAQADYFNRDPLPSCGRVAVELGVLEHGPFPDGLVRCMETARLAGGEVTATSADDRGDPHTLSLRVGPDITGIQVFRNDTPPSAGYVIFSEYVCGVATDINDVSCLEHQPE
jgi:FlaG/FlaF family flagellin (archaellin)